MKLGKFSSKLTPNLLSVWANSVEWIELYVKSTAICVDSVRENPFNIPESSALAKTSPVPWKLPLTILLNEYVISFFTQS